MAEDRAARLARELRENLKKRKAQARARGPEPSHGADEEGDVAPTAKPGGWVAPKGD